MIKSTIILNILRRAIQWPGEAEKGVAEIEQKSKMYRAAAYMLLSVVKENIPSNSIEDQLRIFHILSKTAGLLKRILV